LGAKGGVNYRDGACSSAYFRTRLILTILRRILAKRPCCVNERTQREWPRRNYRFCRRRYTRQDYSYFEQWRQGGVLRDVSSQPFDSPISFPLLALLYFNSSTTHLLKTYIGPHPPRFPLQCRTSLKTLSCSDPQWALPPNYAPQTSLRPSIISGPW
jgi:hypothetical protein